MKNMQSSGKPRTFLATTALDEFWDKTQPIIFLGEWCTFYGNKNIWQTLDCETLDHVFDTKTCDEICEYINKISSGILPELACWLNKVHKTSHPIRYWEILLSPFLFYHTKIVYDRFQRIKKAFSLFPGLKSIGLDANSFFTPLDGDEYYHFANQNNVWNLQLTTQIIDILYPGSLRYIDGKKYTDLILETRKEKLIAKKKSYSIKARFKILLLWLLIKLRGNKCVAFLSHIDFTKKNKFLLMLYSGFKIIPVEPFIGYANYQNQLIDSVDLVLRSEIRQLSAPDDFSRLVLDLLVVNMPLSFIENYKNISKDSEKKYPFFAKVLAGVSLFNEETRLFAARYFRKNMIVAGAQHSGSYGTLKISDEFLEYQFVDFFLEWGTKNNGKTIALPAVLICQRIAAGSLQLEERTKKYHILWITTEFIPYTPEINQSIDGQYDQKFYFWNVSILQLIKEDVLQKIVVRLRHTEFSDNWKFLRDKFPTLCFHKPDNKNSFHEEIFRANLLLFDNIQSTFFYGLAYNIPTIIFCNTDIYTVQDSAKYYFDLLESVGIFHRTPESAADMINRVHENTQYWWNKKEVQAARKIFCDYFIKYSNNWLFEWKNELCALLKDR